MRYAIVGVGQCGNRLADALHDPLSGSTLSRLTGGRPADASFLAINISEQDLADLDDLGRKERIELDGPPGTGANRALGREALEENRSRIQEALADLDEADAVLVLGATGGGTGGALLPGVVEILRGMRPSTPIFAVGVLPFDQESAIYHRNTAETLAELAKTDANTTILVSNDRLGQPDVALSRAHETTNAALADRLAMLLTTMGAEMELSIDLGDLLTVTDIGNGFSTLGYAQGSEHQPLKEVISLSFRPDHQLLDVDPKEDGKRALVLMEGREDQLNMDAIMSALSELSDPIGDVFKGVRVTKDEPRVLTLLSLGPNETVDRLLEGAAEAEGDDGSDRVTESLENVGDYELD